MTKQEQKETFERLGASIGTAIDGLLLLARYLAVSGYLIHKLARWEQDRNYPSLKRQPE